MLEIGSGNGDLLAALQCSQGVGIGYLRQNAPTGGEQSHLQSKHMSGERLDLSGQQFDFVILFDLVGYLHDIRLVFERQRTVCQSRTRIVLNGKAGYGNPFWP